jgi:Queuosine biosynthesis protein QueC
MKLDNLKFKDINFGIYRDGPVGVSASCGADSAVILYLLMKEIQHDLHIYNLIGTKRQHVLEPAIDKVINKCAELTGKSNYFVHKIHAPVPPPELIFNIYKDSLDSGEVDIIYTGLTKFPKEEIYAPWGQPGPEWHKQWRHHDNVQPLFGLEIKIPLGTNCSSPALTIDGNYKESLKQDSRVYNPMINHTKQGIATLYKTLNVEKDLFPVTRSCEDDSNISGHCGNCWWCKERLWAFGYLE